MNDLKYVKLPQIQGARRIFNPVLLVFISCLVNTFFQVITSKEKWNSFYIFGISSDYEILYVYLFFFFAFSIGALSAYFIVRMGNNKSAIIQSQYCLKAQKVKTLLYVFFILNLVTFLISQLQMGHANIYNLYVIGDVSVKEINDSINNSSFGIHGISILLGYCFIPIFGASLLIGGNKRITYINLFIVLLKFIAFGKLQSLVCLFFAFILFSPNVAYKKLFFYMCLTIALFTVTRVIRNPDQNLLESGDFLLKFIGGYYLGSPVVNSMYIYKYDIHDLVYFFNWTIPQKIIGKSTIVDMLPDTTSPLGLFGTTYLSFGLLGIIYLWLIGFITQFIFSLQSTKLSFYLFSPILVMTLTFSMMYNNFINTVFLSYLLF